MAGSFSDYLEAALLNHVFGGSASFTRPANVYFAAFTVAPTDAGGGTECSGGSYARVEMPNDETTFSPATPGLPTSTGLVSTVTWPTATASWGGVVAVGVFDAPTGGNLLVWSTTTTKAVGNGDTLRILSGFFGISID